MQFFPELTFCRKEKKRRGGVCPVSVSLQPRPCAGVVLDSLSCVARIYCALTMCTALNSGRHGPENTSITNTTKPCSRDDLGRTKYA